MGGVGVSFKRWHMSEGDMVLKFPGQDIGHGNFDKIASCFVLGWDIFLPAPSV